VLLLAREQLNRELEFLKVFRQNLLKPVKHENGDEEN
jgi:hypothetical protein